MAVLHAAQRDKLESSSFAVPGQRKLPMHDRTHALLAWKMVDRTQGLSPTEKTQARTNIKNRLTSMGVDTSKFKSHGSETDDVAREQHSSVFGYADNNSLTKPKTADKNVWEDAVNTYKADEKHSDKLHIVGQVGAMAKKALGKTGSMANHKINGRDAHAMTDAELGAALVDSQHASTNGEGGYFGEANITGKGEYTPENSVTNHQAPARSGNPDIEKHSGFASVGDVTSMGGTTQMGTSNPTNKLNGVYDEAHTQPNATGFYGKGPTTGDKGTPSITGKGDGSAVRAADASGKKTGPLNEIFQNYGTDIEDFSLDELVDSATEGLSSALSFVPDLNMLDAYDMVMSIEDHLTNMALSSFSALKGPSEVNCYFSNAIGEAQFLELSESGAKLKIPVARFGTFVHPAYGLVTFGQRDFDEMQENFASDEAGFKPYLRYGHARFPGAVDGEAAVAYLEKLQQEGDVLWGVYDPLDDKLVAEIKKGAYVNASAELKRYAMSKKDGRPIGTLLTAHALTNAPFVPGMPNNQVLSDAGSSNNRREAHITLNLSEGEQLMPNGNANTEALSTLMSELETLSITTEQRHSIREKLASLMDHGSESGVEPNREDNPEPGKPGTAYHTETTGTAAAGKSPESQAINKPAGKASEVYAAGGEALSHGDPLKEAGKALETMGKSEDKEDADEKMSSLFGEMLSNMAKMMPFFAKKGAKPAAPTGNPFAKGGADEKNSNSNMLPAKGAEGGNGKTAFLSDTATHNNEEESHMNEAQVKSLLTEAIAGVEQKFSDQLAEKDQKIQSLETQLTETKTTAQQFSNHLVDSAFTSRVDALVAAGVPAVTVQKVAEVARMVRGTEQKLSNGESVDAAELLFRALDAMPGENRIAYGQTGQNLSDAGSDQEYAEIIARVQESQGKID